MADANSPGRVRRTPSAEPGRRQGPLGPRTILWQHQHIPIMTVTQRGPVINRFSKCRAFQKNVGHLRFVQRG